jgi:hypothetical protein
MTKCARCFAVLNQPRAEHPRGRRYPPPSLTDPPPVEVDACPSCGAAVAAGWTSHSSTCIAMAGARTTGKSIYIAVMIKQLEQYAAQVGMDVRPTEAVEPTFTEFYLKPLYEQRNIMRPTDSLAIESAYQREPLIFVITAKDGSLHHLVIRDVAGEDLEKPDELKSGQLNFFANADSVFFLFDPLRVPEIKNQLRGLVPDQTLGGEPWVVLKNTLRLVQGGTPRLAVILSKFDTLQALRKIKGGGEWSSIMRNAGAAFFRDPGPTVATSNDMDGEQLHEEVRSLLIKLAAGALVNRVEVAGARGGYRFFAVSALGDSPKGESLNPRGIAPFRCLDPLRWAMAPTGVL